MQESKLRKSRLKIIPGLIPAWHWVNAQEPKKAKPECVIQ